jgi:hypothetical protein
MMGAVLARWDYVRNVPCAHKAFVLRALPVGPLKGSDDA